MALKTISLSNPELVQGVNTVATANAGENLTIESLFVSHRNEPIRLDVNNNTINPLDLRVGSRVESSANTCVAEISEGFQLIASSDKEYDPTLGTTANRGNVYIQLQKVISGNVVTGPALPIFSSLAMTYTNANYQAFEIYPGMILILASIPNAPISSVAATFSYNTTTLGLTYLNQLNTSKLYGISAEKIVDGRVYYIGKTSTDASTSNTVNLLKVVNGTGVITETANVVSGFESSGSSDPVGPAISITPKSICRATLDSNQFLIAIMNGNNNLTWLVIQFNTADDSTTIVNRVANYVGLGTFNVQPIVIPAYGTTGFKVFILCSNSSSVNSYVYCINNATATTPVTSVNAGFSIVSNTLGNSLRMNPSNKKSYLFSFQSYPLTDQRLLSFTWSDANNNLVITNSPILKQDSSKYENEISFLSFFNNTLYITGTIFNTFYSRIDPSTGQIFEPTKFWTGTPILESTRIKWSNFYNAYVVASKSNIYLLDAAGNILSITILPFSSILAYDVSPTGVFSMIANASSNYATGPVFTTTAIYVEIGSLNTIRNTSSYGVATVNSSFANFTVCDNGGTNYTALPQDLVCFDTGCVMVSKSNSSGGSASYGVYLHYIPYGTALTGNYAASANNGNGILSVTNLNPVAWFQARIIKTSSNTAKMIYSLGQGSPTINSLLYRLVGSNFLSYTNNISYTAPIVNPLYASISLSVTSMNMLPYVNSSNIGLVSMVTGTYTYGFRHVLVDGNVYQPLYGTENLHKVIAGRIGNLIGVLEEYATVKVFRVFDERTGPLAVEIVGSRIITTETFTSPTTMEGSVVLDTVNSALTFYGAGGRNYVLRSPGVTDFTVDLRILKADGSTIQPVISAYPVRVGSTFALGNSPIYLASGETLQAVSSKIWVGSLSGLSIARLNTANAT